jgi:hypothetical protein
MKTISKIILALILISFSLTAFAEKKGPNILFEGWFQVLLGPKKIGYFVERYQFEDNKFKYVSFLKTNADGNSISESLEAISDAAIGPLSSTYVTTVGKEPKIVKTTIKKDLMTVVTTLGDSKPVQESKKIKKNTFFSSFLMYIILKNDGLKVGNKFDYYGIAEEEGKAYLGTINVKGKEPVRGKKAFRLTNLFKGSNFIIWVTDHGEPLLVRQPENNVDVRFAETQKEATADMEVNTKNLTLLFGKIPGDHSVESEKKKPAEVRVATPPPSESPTPSE